MLAGLLLVNPILKLDGGSQRVIRRVTDTRSGKVGIAPGGGSGHLPLFTGDVGEGLLDTCSIGNVFEGPNVESFEDASRLAHGSATCEEVVKQTLGEDLTNPEFWATALKAIEPSLAAYEAV
ncbi:MAG: dihydroxyacetone kinase subunit DhaK [Roseimicrobium sp.]